MSLPFSMTAGSLARLRPSSPPTSEQSLPHLTTWAGLAGYRSIVTEREALPFHASSAFLPPASQLEAFHEWGGEG